MQSVQFAGQDEQTVSVFTSHATASNVPGLQVLQGWQRPVEARSQYSPTGQVVQVGGLASATEAAPSKTTKTLETTTARWRIDGTCPSAPLPTSVVLGLHASHTHRACRATSPPSGAEADGIALDVGPSRGIVGPMPRGDLEIIVNPHARRGAAERAAAALRGRLPATVRLHVPRTGDALSESCREIRARRSSTIAIVGGDGTLHRVLTALHETYGDDPLPAIALLRGGTMNTVANALGVPRRGMATLLRRALATHAGEPSGFVVRPTMRCEGKLATLFGVGVVPAFLEAYYATGNPSPIHAAKVLAAALAQKRSEGPLWRSLTGGVEAGLTLDEGASYPRERVLAIAAGTIDQIGLGFRPFHRAFETEDAMHLVRVKAGGLASRPSSRASASAGPCRRRAEPIIRRAASRSTSRALASPTCSTATCTSTRDPPFV